MESPSKNAIEMILRDELAYGDAIYTSLPVMLSHIANAGEMSLYNEALITSLRVMARGVAEEILAPEIAGQGMETRHVGHVEKLTYALLNDEHFLMFSHALAFEGQLIAALSQRYRIDSVTPPLLSAMMASSRPDQGDAAMRVLAAQSRFLQHIRRMELPLAELPTQLYAHVLEIAVHNLDEETPIAIAMRRDLSTHDTRLEQLERVISILGDDANQALSLPYAGVSLFVSALSLKLNQPREAITLAAHESQLGRFALYLRASGLDNDAIEEQFLHLYPDIALLEGYDVITPADAARILGLESRAAEMEKQA